MRELMIKKLQTIKEEMEKSVEDLQAKQIMDIMVKGESKIPALEKIQTRIKDINWLVPAIEKINFVTNIPEEIENCLSPYGTFFDRTNLYYNSELLNEFLNLTEDQKIQIMFCEIFNSYQSYYVNKNANNVSETIEGISLLMMYHVGIIPEKMVYAQSRRTQLKQLFFEKFPESTTISFGPNENAGRYILKKWLLENDRNFGWIGLNKSTLNHFSAQVLPTYIFPTEGGGLSWCHLNYVPDETKKYGKLHYKFTKKIK